MFDSISKPQILITDSYNFLYNQVRKRTRDEKLLENILKTLRNEGNILICTDTAGRVLELAHFLDLIWKSEVSGLSAYSIALLNNVSISVIEFAKSQVEWMNDKIVQSFESGRNNPFDFRHIKLCRTLSELNKITTPSKHKIVLASTPDLQYGFSRSLFLEWCENPKNSIIFTHRTPADTLANMLIENPKKNITLEVSLFNFYILNTLNYYLINKQVKKRVKLEGAELDEYYRQQYEIEKEKLERIQKSKELE